MRIVESIDKDFIKDVKEYIEHHGYAYKSLERAVNKIITTCSSTSDDDDGVPHDIDLNKSDIRRVTKEDMDNNLDKYMASDAIFIFNKDYSTFTYYDFSELGMDSEATREDFLRKAANANLDCFIVRYEFKDKELLKLRKANSDSPSNALNRSVGFDYNIYNKYHYDSYNVPSKHVLHSLKYRLTVIADDINTVKTNLAHATDQEQIRELTASLEDLRRRYRTTFDDYVKLKTIRDYFDAGYRDITSFSNLRKPFMTYTSLKARKNYYKRELEELKKLVTNSDFLLDDEDESTYKDQLKQAKEELEEIETDINKVSKELDQAKKDDEADLERLSVDLDKAASEFVDAQLKVNKFLGKPVNEAYNIAEDIPDYMRDFDDKSIWPWGSPIKNK